MSPARRTGFTLIELLVVVALILVVMAMLVPAMTTMLRGTQLTQATETVTSQLSLARQTALSRNQIVEVRFYKYVNPEDAGGAAAFRAIQVFEVPQSGGGPLALGSAQRLPQSIVVDGGGTLSSLFDAQKRVSHASDLPLPGVGNTYTYFSFRYNQDGSTDLSTMETWFLTVHGQNDGDNRTSPPANFATIQIDPTEGTTRVFRP